MLRRALVAGIAAILLVVAVAIPALAITTQSWEERRIATAAFDAAADAATEALTDSETARAALVDSRDAALLALDDAHLTVTAAAGYFSAQLVTALQARAAELDTSLATEVPDGPAMPSTTAPDTISELNAAVEPLATWAAGEAERASSVRSLASEQLRLSAEATDAAVKLAETVGSEASLALGAAPLASVGARSAVESARDAVIAAVESQEALGKLVGEYTAAVSSLRVSQQAAVDAAAAAAADSSADSGGSARSGRGVPGAGVTITPCVADPNADFGVTCP